MSKFDWHKTAAIVISVAGVLIAVWLLCKTVLFLFLPFLLAFLLALVTRPLVLRFHERTKCPVRICAVLITLGALVLLTLFLFVICNRLVLEAQNLLDYLIADSNNPQGEIARAVAFFKDLWGRLPFVSHLARVSFLRDIIGDPEQYFVTQLQEYLSSLAGGIAGVLGQVLRRLPGVLLFLLVTLISCFYFAVEYETVKGAAYRYLPKSVTVRLPRWRKRGGRAVRRYLRAYFLLFLLTLAELAVGLLILGVGYPILLAFIIAFLDILPVLGVGTVLLPWAIISLAVGRTARGVGLLVLYLIITVIRQIAEPHLVGKSLGMHPILMLISFYVGLRLFGAVGIFLGPGIALLVKGFLERRESEQGI